LITGARWALVCLVSTNRSQREMVTVSEAESSAVQYRLIELDMNNSPDFSREQQMSFRDDWADIQGCAGALGAVIERMACELGAEKINRLVMDCVTRAAQLVESDKEDRFQFRALGAMLATQLILKKLGMEMFDTAEMLECFRQSNDLAKDYIKENTLPTNGLELLSRFLKDMRASTLITETRGSTKGHVNGRHYAAHVGARFPDNVVARFIKDEGTVYVEREALMEWCRAAHVREIEILGPARTAEVMVYLYPAAKLKKWADNFNLTTGMRENLGVQTRCLAFRIDQLRRFTGPIEELENPSANVVPLRQEVPPEETVAA
jgi:hypothetical protein